jgi:hypothetical protein
VPKKLSFFSPFCYHDDMPRPLAASRKPFVTFRSLGRMGRLGNQLFQIAATIGVAKQHGFDYMFPRWPPSRWFKHRLPTRKIRKRLPTHRQVDCEPYTIRLNGSTDLYGYFEGYTWFEHCQDVIRRQFEPQTAIANNLHRQYADLLKENPCAVHVRRGDYVGRDDRFELWDTDYYDRAFEHFPDTKFLMFSDDMPWVRERFQGPQFHYAGHAPHLDLFLMAMCKQHIIVNSTFSWWGAWLANSEKVIHPLPWITWRPYPKGLFLEHWTSLNI